MPAVDDGAAVDGDHVALADAPVTWDAVDDLVVDRHADVSGEAVVAQEGRGRPRVANGLSSAVVHLGGGDARGGDLGDPLKGAGDDQAGRPHGLDLVRRLDLDAVA